MIARDPLAQNACVLRRRDRFIVALGHSKPTVDLQAQTAACLRESDSNHEAAANVK
jgi:hypothetical protein